MINVHSIVSKNSINYFKYMIKNYSSMASSKKEIIFYAHCLDPFSVSYLKNYDSNIKLISVYKKPKFFVLNSKKDILIYIAALLRLPTKLSGSNGHSAGISSALSIVDQNINLIVDSDTVILKKSWDSFIIKQLKNYGIIGTSYEKIGGFSSGLGRTQTYKKKPNLTWVALSPRYDWSKFDPRPNKSVNITINSRKLSNLYNLPVGYSMACDVGWRMPSFLDLNKIPFLIFDQIKPTSSKAVAIKTGMDYHEEFHCNNKIFLAHQRGSHQHPFRKI